MTYNLTNQPSYYIRRLILKCRVITYLYMLVWLPTANNKQMNLNLR